MSQLPLTTVVGATLAIIVVAIAILAFVLWRRARNKPLRKLMRTVSDDSLVNFVIPDGLGGHIHIDHLLLTAHGLLLLETRDTQGTIFAGDRMDLWSATHQGTRFTFDNPIPMMEQRSAAVSLLAPDVPIEARVLFIADATFPKGHPSAVSTVPGLIEEFRSLKSRGESHNFSRHWQTIKSAASSA